MFYLLRLQQLKFIFVVAIVADLCCGKRITNENIELQPVMNN